MKLTINIGNTVIHEVESSDLFTGLRTLHTYLSSCPLGNATNVYLMDIGERKIMVIKRIRSLFGHGLKEAKDIAETKHVCLAENVEIGSAKAIAIAMEEVGARCLIGGTVT